MGPTGTDSTLGKLVLFIILLVLVFCTFATFVGHIIGGVIGGIILLVLLVVTLCAVVIGVIQKRKSKVHTLKGVSPLPLHYGEYNTIQDWILIMHH